MRAQSPYVEVLGSEEGRIPPPREFAEISPNWPQIWLGGRHLGTERVDSRSSRTRVRHDRRRGEDRVPRVADEPHANVVRVRKQARRRAGHPRTRRSVRLSSHRRPRRRRCRCRACISGTPGLRSADPPQRRKHRQSVPRARNYTNPAPVFRPDAALGPLSGADAVRTKRINWDGARLPVPAFDAPSRPPEALALPVATRQRYLEVPSREYLTDQAR